MIGFGSVFTVTGSGDDMDEEDKITSPRWRFRLASSADSRAICQAVCMTSSFTRSNEGSATFVSTN
jgi:hypothetical protein